MAASSCGSLGPSQPVEEVRAGAFAGVECEPGLVLECEPACSRGDARACEIAGLGYLEGKAVTRDLPRARIMLERACEKDQPLACSGWAKMAEDGHGVELSDERRATLLSLGCDQGDGNACYRLGQRVLDASKKPSQREYTRAHDYFERACSAHDAHGCVQLGIDAKTGRAGTKDVLKAATLLDAACSEDLGVACYELGDLQVSPGTAVHNPVRGRQHFDKACSLSSGVACASLARLMEAGEKNVARARQLHEHACDLQQWHSCLALGFYELETTPSSAEASFDKACTGGLVEGCFERAKLLDGRSPGLEPAPDEALPLYEKACAANLRPACSYAAHLELRKLPSGMIPRESRERLTTLTMRGCNEERQDESCLVLAGWLSAGENGLPKDAKRAAGLLGPLCAKAAPDAPAESSAELDSIAYGSACFQLGRQHERGRGAEKNLLGASTLYEKGCAAGHSPACLAHAVLLWRGNKGSKRDPELAVSRFEQACKATGESTVRADACVHLGYAQMTGIGTPRDLRLAKANFERYCADGHQLACAFLGHYLVTTKGPELDRKKGETLLRSACDSANGHGCLFLADLPSVTKTQRSTLLTRACLLEVDEACTFKELASP